MSERILFVDRDGTILEEPEHFQVDRFEKIKFVEGVLPALKRLREAGWKHLERLGEHYEGADDPTLVFFSVEEPEAFVCNHDEWVPVEL